jgi:molybdopterin-guanine dinucleotide biosynthesis protein A
MGRDKAALPHPDGGTFLSQTIDRLSQECEDVVVSGQTSAPHQTTTLKDPVLHRGPATGIATALRYCQRKSIDACFVLPTDTPFLTLLDLEKIKQHWLASDQLTIAITDQPQPLIGIYPVELTTQLQQLAESEDCSLKRWINFQTHTTVPLSAEHCRNINTPEDLSHGR